MGKRKPTSTTPHLNNPSTEPHPSSPSPSGDMPFSSATELLSHEKSSHLLVSNEVKQTQVHCNLGRLSKRSRHHYGHHYSRRIAGNHVGSSSSHPKNRHPSRDDRLPFKHMHQGGDLRG
ncbi:hypothetical protein LINGRAHAP2_LOCUS30940 [Linum grandiflorum]